MSARSSASPHDPVTGLLTRQKLMSDAPRFVSRAQRLVMITLADARHYNEILRALGHDYADEFVRTALARIRDVVPDSIEIYHVSVLSFVFVCDASGGEAGADVLVAGLIDAFGHPVRCSGIPIQSRVGIGVVAFNPDDVAVCLRTALVAAQDSRNNETGWAEYDRSIDDAHRRSFQLLSDLPAALQANNQMSLLYQPKINFATGACCGAEALLRWVHPSLGSISPGTFIPMVENTALIGPVTEWVIREAVRQLGEWSTVCVPLHMAVNVSPHNLMQTGFTEMVLSVLEHEKVDPHNLELEFTEGVLVNYEPKVVRGLQSLRDAGVRIAFDDFGTGFSNLSYLTSLPADILKLDQSFIRKIYTDPDTALLVRTFIELAQKLGYVVVAEGIEDSASYELLRAWGCDEGQGFFMSKPLAVELFLPWLGSFVGGGEILR
jgi:EAL domain-containing protein (putative c-di-GMP-specific phosphodiesterase class I)/GGDEF domain-containing protein